MPSGMSNAISGLTNYQKLIDVVGNNIANLNTPGFKAVNVSFKELMSQTIKGASAPTGNTGGTNPVQLGLGTTISSMEQNITQGPIEITGKSTDMAITGNGYFILKDSLAVRYSRSGNFSIDSNGDLVNPNGMKVQGWTTKNTDGSIDTAGGAGTMTSINIPLGQSVSAKASTQMIYTGNFDTSAATVPAATTPADPIADPYPNPVTVPAPSYVTKVTGYDAMGGATEITLFFYHRPVAAPTATHAAEWEYYAYGKQSTSAVNTFDQLGTGLLVYDDEGKYNATDSTIGTIDYSPVNNSAAVSITPDFALTTQLDTDESSVVLRSQDGAKAGSLETFTIDSNGLIVGNYTNGNAENLGQVALASFTNPVGLNKVENGLYIPSANPGIAVVGTANTGSRGSINGTALEGSNVDLGNEFTKMIIAQRAFQANSRVVTTYDEMLSEVSNLKR